MILHKLFHFSLLITHDTLTITTALCWLLKKNSLIPAASNIIILILIISTWHSCQRNAIPLHYSVMHVCRKVKKLKVKHH